MVDIGVVGKWLAGTSAVGTSAFGIVEALKKTPVGVIGADHVVDAIGDPGQKAFQALYGDDYKAVIEQAYRGDPKKPEEQLKNALRLALRSQKLANAIAIKLGQGPMEPDLGEAVAALDAHNNGSAPLEPKDLARYTSRVAAYTMAVDARVDAALASAASDYEAGMRIWAMVVAMLLSVFAWAVLYGTESTFWKALLIGVVAVPVAPVAKDATSLLQTASDLLGQRQRASK